MTKWRKIAYLIYPFLIGFILPAVIYMFDRGEAKAGSIRKAELSPEHPLVVRLALGRSTAISFSSKPEKVVPGSPEALEINFLGKDLTLRPLGSRPGNLIVYTKNSRYVILLQIASESSYDDAITVNTGANSNRPIRLVEDTFRIGEIKVVNLQTKKESTFTAFIKQNGKTLESDSFPPGLHCTGCILKNQKPVDGRLNQLLCSRSIQKIECKSDGTSLRFERNASED